MAASAIWDNARVIQVYFEDGSFNNDSSVKKIRKAPIDIFIMDGEFMIKTCVALPNNNFTDVTYSSNSDGGILPERLIMGSHELGDFKKDISSWRGIYQFNFK